MLPSHVDSRETGDALSTPAAKACSSCRKTNFLYRKFSFNCTSESCLESMLGACTIVLKVMQGVPQGELGGVLGGGGERHFVIARNKDNSNGIIQCRWSNRKRERERERERLTDPYLTAIEATVIQTGPQQPHLRDDVNEIEKFDGQVYKGQAGAGPTHTKTGIHRS